MVWRKRIYRIAFATYKPVRSKDPIRNQEYIMHRPTAGIKSHSDAACIGTECKTQRKE